MQLRSKFPLWHRAKSHPPDAFSPGSVSGVKNGVDSRGRNSAPRLLGSRLRRPREREASKCFLISRAILLLIFIVSLYLLYSYSYPSSSAPFFFSFFFVFHIFLFISYWLFFLLFFSLFFLFFLFLPLLSSFLFFSSSKFKLCLLEF